MAAITGTSTRSSPNLDAQVRTYRAQLADWVTCPSAKTPQGKAKIGQISDKLDVVKKEIKKLDVAAPADPQHGVQSSSPPSTANAAPATYLSIPSRVGASVDTHA